MIIISLVPFKGQRFVNIKNSISQENLIIFWASYGLSKECLFLTFFMKCEL